MNYCRYGRSERCTGYPRDQRGACVHTDCIENGLDMIANRELTTAEFACNLRSWFSRDEAIRHKPKSKTG